MDKKLKIALLGFTGQIKKNIEKSLENYSNNLTTFSSLEDKTIDLETYTLDNDFDVIILNPIHLQQTLVDSLNILKNNCPLSEIILVSFGSNFDMAVKAFRAGVRDIISYPIDQAEFNNILDKCFNYRVILQRSKKLSKFVEIISLYGDGSIFSSSEEFFERINKTVKTEFYSTGIYIIEVSFREKNITEDKIFWNHQLFEEEYSSYHFRQWIHGVNIQYIKERKNLMIYKNIKNEMHFVFYLGDIEKNSYLGGLKIKLNDVTDLELELIGLFTRVIHNSFKQIMHLKIHKKLSNLIHIDDVTGLFNQRKLKSDIGDLISLNRVSHKGFSVFFIDVDDFKQINDRYGHLVGSLILVEIGKELKKTIRESDYIYRYGGDEFVIIIPDLSKDDAHKIGKRLLKAILHKSFSNYAKDYPVPSLNLSVSIGISYFPKDARTKEEILNLADQMMYMAKKAGKGKVLDTVDGKNYKDTIIEIEEKDKNVVGGD